MMSSDIKYGEELTLINSQTDLLKQICLRLDRHFPKAHSQLLLAAAQDDATQLIVAWALQLETLGLIEMANALRSLVGIVVDDGGDT